MPEFDELVQCRLVIRAFCPDSWDRDEIDRGSEFASDPVTALTQKPPLFRHFGKLVCDGSHDGHPCSVGREELTARWILVIADWKSTRRRYCSLSVGLGR
jgi:hypothetical protein